MTEAAYDSEGVLQALIAKFPDLLAGDQLPGGEPRRWLLVGREASVPDAEQGAGRWSVDHLFLDQDGVPTLVEVKRSTDTRIRREVVGQLIDYAANAVVYWPIDTVRSKFEARIDSEGLEPDVELATVIQGDANPDSYWEQVAANLRGGRIRLVFVADDIPRELRRVVEFLNEQMVAEVIAIEVKQFVGPDGLRTLVPRVIGQSAAAESRKGSREKRQWDEESFLDEIESRRGEVDARLSRDLIDWSRPRFPRFTWGTGITVGSFFPILDHAGENYWPFSLRTDGGVTIELRALTTRPPFDDVELRREFIRRLNETPSVAIPMDADSRRPSFRLAVLDADPRALDAFKRALDWFCEIVRSARRGSSPG